MNSRPDPDSVFTALAPLLRRLCQDQLRGLSPTTQLADVSGLDSLRLIEAIALLEEHFHVVVDTDRLNDLRAIRDIMLMLADAQPDVA